jgi:tripartite-type tricarboxylate transporter receptor subunit TctC
MKVHRRRLLCIAAASAVLPALMRTANAQTYPTRPVRCIVGYPPGGGVDIFVRLMGQWLSERFGEQFVVDNRPGAAGNIATEAVVRAPADGHTLLGFDAAATINSSLYANLNFNFIRDIGPVVGIVRTPNVLLLHPSVPADTVPEFIAYGRSNPGELNVASGGLGTTTHLTGELFKMLTGVSMVHVPYRGSAPALTDLVSGQIQVCFGPLPPSIQFVRDGKLRALAVTSATRADALPDIPVLGDFVQGFEANDWTGLGVPTSTPAEIVDRLNKEINAALHDPRIKTRVAELGGVGLGGSPTDFGTLIAEDTEKWGKVVRFSGIRVD